MKQVWILIVSVILLITAGVCEIKYLNNTSRYLQADLDYIENAVKNGNYEYARSQIDNTFASWEKLKNVWNIFITNDEIDIININLVELKHYLNYEEEEDAIIAVEKIKSSIAHCISRQNLKLDNVL